MMYKHDPLSIMKLNTPHHTTTMVMWEGGRCQRAQRLHPPAPGLHHGPCGRGGPPPLQVHRAPQGHRQRGQDVSPRGGSIGTLRHGPGTHIMNGICI